VRDGNHFGPDRFDSNKATSFTITAPEPKPVAQNQLPVINSLVPDKASPQKEATLVVSVSEYPNGFPGNAGPNTVTTLKYLQATGTVEFDSGYSQGPAWKYDSFTGSEMFFQGSADGVLVRIG